MLDNVKDIVTRNSKLIIITFELFWIIIFLLDTYTKGVSDIPEFVYVNF